MCLGDTAKCLCLGLAITLPDMCGHKNLETRLPFLGTPAKGFLEVENHSKDLINNLKGNLRSAKKLPNRFFFSRVYSDVKEHAAGNSELP